MRFQPGDLAIVRSLPSIDQEFHGREVTVLSELVTRPKRKGVWYRVDLEGERPHWYARPEALKPLPPPDTPSTWEEGVWRPKVLTVDLSGILDAEMTE